MKTSVILAYIISVLYSNFQLVFLSSHIQYPIKHDLFQSMLQVNNNFIYYQHRLVIGHIVTLPCEFQSIDHDKSNDRTIDNQSIIYEWLFNGRQLLPHRAFFNANWDIYGYLTIWAMISRQITIWCHKQILTMNNNNDTQDYYYSHQITFINLAILNQIAGIKVDVNMDAYAILHKCQVDYYTCDCQLTSSVNVTLSHESTQSKHYVLEKLEKFSQSICHNLIFCINFYLNDFLCMNKVNDSRSMHYAEFTFTLDNFRRYTINSTGTTITLDSFGLFKEFVRKFNEELPSIKTALTVMLRNKFSTEQIKIKIAPYYHSMHYCMGPSGKLIPTHSECDLCSPGSYYPSRIFNPPPPFIDELAMRSTVNQPIFTNQNYRSVYSTDDNDPTTCLPCPLNTYSEEYGQSSCLPCPFQYSRPIDFESEEPINGSDWLHTACTTESRSELHMIQIFRRILGKTISDYIKNATIIKRAGILCFILALPGIITFILVFIAYVMIDVSSTLIQMARTLYPLQLQLAEICTANARMDVEQSEAAEKLYKHMKNE
ncbi:hypothetical protein KSF78_0003493 [Schistosoma japonicum]|nr:hypothetical protein KSF78_0003493 [Schistosoma japonicum]